MNLLRGYRLCSIGMLGIRRLIFWPFGPALVPLGSFVLEPYFNTFGQRLLGSSSFAGAQGLTTQLKQETPIPPLPVGQQRQITRLLDDLTQETRGFLKHLAVFLMWLYWGYTKIPAKAAIGRGGKCFHILYAQFLGGIILPMTRLIRAVGHDPIV